MVQDGDVHRRNAIDGCRFRSRDGIHHDQRIELFDHDRRRAMRQNRHDAQHAAEAMEQRHRQADAFVLVRVEFKELSFTDVETVVQDALMRQHDAFRETCRARRVLHVHHVHVGDVLLGRRETVVQILAAAVAQLNQFGRRVHACMFLLSKIHDVFQPRETLAYKHAARRRKQFWDKLIDGVDIADVAQTVHDGQRVHVRLLHKIFQLMLFVVRVDRHENGADFRRREHERQPFGNVSRPDADMTSLRHANGHETFRHEIRTDVEIFVSPCQIAIWIHDERMVRAIFHLHGEHVADCLRRETQRRDFMADQADFLLQKADSLHVVFRRRFFNLAFEQLALLVEQTSGHHAHMVFIACKLFGLAFPAVAVPIKQFLAAFQFLQTLFNIFCLLFGFVCLQLAFQRLAFFVNRLLAFVQSRFFVVNGDFALIDLLLLSFQPCLDVFD